MPSSFEGVTLYKYRAYSAYALEMLINRELYFARPDQLNDPYDCRLNIRDSLGAAIARAGQIQNRALRERLQRLRGIDDVYEKMDHDLSILGVFSLSRTPTHVLLWSHYAQNHTGFCAGFRFSDALTTHHGPHGIIGATDIGYSTSNPFIEFFEEVASSSTAPEWDDVWQTLLAVGMAAKADTWRYEEEVRILRRESGLVPFSAVELNEIVFGLNMPTRSRDTVRRILSDADWPHVKFKEIIRVHDFSLELRDAT
jgi:hypothetical protein